MSSINLNKEKKLQKKISDSIAKGELWRAREDYNALIRICGFNQKIYLSFAELLLKMHENLLAGKFLFLSGNRSEEAVKDIELFLNRYKGKKFISIKSQFPLVAQKMKLEDFPEPLREEFKKWNFLDESSTNKKNSLFEKLSLYFLFIIIAVVFISIPVGLVSMFKFLFM